MNPSSARAWQRIFRDTALVVVATFMLVHETLSADAPNPYIVGAALAMFGLPPALRLDAKRREDDEDGKP